MHTQTVTVPELDFETTFHLTADASSTIHAFLGHFDTFFTNDGRLIDSLKVRSKDDMSSGEVRFGTGSKEGATHWKQTLFVLKHPEQVKSGMFPSLFSLFLQIDVCYCADTGNVQARSSRVHSSVQRILKIREN